MNANEVIVHESAYSYKIGHKFNGVNWYAYRERGIEMVSDRTGEAYYRWAQGAETMSGRNEAEAEAIAHEWMAEHGVGPLVRQYGGGGEYSMPF